MIRKMIAGLALVAGSLGVGAQRADALPPASFVCMNERPTGSVNQWQVVYAEYDDFTVSYVRAACWLHWIGPGPSLNCVGYAYLFTDMTTGNGGWDC